MEAYDLTTIRQPVNRMVEATIETLIDGAVLTACAEVPGPVHIGLPSDLAEQEAATAPSPGEPPGPPALSHAPRTDQVSTSVPRLSLTPPPIVPMGHPWHAPDAEPCRR